MGCEGKDRWLETSLIASVWMGLCHHGGWSFISGQVNRRPVAFFIFPGDWAWTSLTRLWVAAVAGGNDMFAVGVSSGTKLARSWARVLAVSTSVYLEYEFGSGTGNMLI